MIKNADLTLLITLKDRFEFTKRMCLYFSEIQYPFHIIFADGSLENEAEMFFKTLENPGFSYEYIRYPKDTTYSHYYKKCASAIKKVKTPYVMLADNDDFPIIDGQLKTIEFLKKNLDYVGCCGRIPGICLSSSSAPYGKNVFFIPYYCDVLYVQRLLNQNTSLERIKEYMKFFTSIFYSVFRTESLIKTFLAIEEQNFKVLYLHEIFFSCLQLSQGKVHFIKNITYIRQKGSSQNAATYYKGIFFDIFYKQMLREIQKSFSYLAKFINKKNYRRIFEEIYNSHYEKVTNDYGFIQLRLLKRFVPLLNKRKILFLVLKIFFEICPAFISIISVFFIKYLINTNDIKFIKKLVTLKKY